MSKKYYECFSAKLTEFLIANGEVPIREYIHRTTGAKCNVFKMNKTLSALLNQWRDTNPNKR